MTVLVTFDGVLRTSNGAANTDMITVCRSLALHTPIRLMLDGDTGEAERWLESRDLFKLFIGAIPSHVQRRSESLREDQLEAALPSGVRLVIDNDPAFIAYAMSRNVAGLLYCHPVFMPPEARPDHRLKPWDALQKEIDKTVTKEDLASTKWEST